MDRTRFDELTRALVAGLPRRRLLQGLAGASLGVALGRPGGEETAAHNLAPKCRKLKDPRKRRQCLKKAKQHNKRHNQPTCSAVGQTCTPPGDCCSGICFDPGGGQNLCGCLGRDAHCQANEQCCSGTCDSGTQLCTCHHADVICTNDSQCCAGLTCQNQQLIGALHVGTCR